MRQGTTPVSVRALARPPGLVLWLASLALAGEDPPLPETRLGTPTAPILLLTRPDVRADLGLSKEQADSAQHVATELYLRAAELKGKPDSLAIPGRRAIDEAQRAWLEENLSA